MSAQAVAPPWALALARVFERAGQPLWVVGGAVRNPLMGLPISDVDMCGPALPREVCALCEGTQVRAVLRAAHFGTVELHVADDQGRHMAEYTTFREDSYRCGHRPEAVRFAKDLSVDALRRDFSVNALYRRCLPEGLNPVEDPTGGLEHLRRGVLHTVTENPDQVLKDDGLRILRAARFQAELGLTPTEGLLDSAARHVPLLKDIAPERLHDELVKVLMADFRYPMLARSAPATQSGLDTICGIGAWPFLFGKLGYDREAARALAGLRLPRELPPAGARLALLLWREDPQEIRRALERLRFPVREQEEAQRLAALLSKAAQEGLSPLEALQAGSGALDFVADALAALGRPEPRERVEALRSRLLERRAPKSLRELALGGEDARLLCQQRGLSLSWVGALLSELWRAVAEGELENERHALLQAAGKWLGSAGE
ncbi:MAG: hypothetical protein VB099_02885 [Candidatus Limiplasma sp.]|nr:hypothetical protein [Candidatus Limiplasma sp.]